MVLLAPLVVLGCFAGAVAAWRALPSIAEAPAASVSALLPAHPRAYATQREAYELFHSELLTPYVMVQRDAGGLSTYAQAHAVARAIAVDRGRVPALRDKIVFALPVLNTLGIVPGSREHGTTALTYLFMRPGTGTTTGPRLAAQYATAFGERDDLIGITGAIPARVAQYRAIKDHLRLVEVTTVLLILLVVGLSFRAVLAPLLTVVTAGIAFVISQHLLGWLSRESGLTMPHELTPVSVALMLGIVTDYSVFFFSGTRQRLAAGDAPREAVRATTARYGPIVLTAGLVVSFGVASLMLGTLGFFRSFGPGMAITVASGLLVAITFVPAVLALLGRAAFWPGLRRASAGIMPWRRRLARFVTFRPVSLVLVVIAVAALVAAGTGVRKTGLGLALIEGLPAGSEAAQAGSAAAQGFAPGMIAPTLVLVRHHGLAGRPAALAHLQRELGAQPGVAAVIGPATPPLSKRFGIVLAPAGDAARYLLVLDAEPTEAKAISILRRIESGMPALLRRADLGGVRVSYGGETELGVETIAAIDTSIWRIAGVAFAVNLTFLILFLRALVAPLYLIAASALALAAAIGLTTYLFQDVLGASGLTYYLPIAVGVLLVSLGSDYNLFVVGRVWQEAARRPLREAVAHAAPRAGRAVAVAGVALAGSFALLALVPIRPFRVFAFAMAAGILIDSLVVRSILVPSLIVLFGRLGFWPRRPPPVRES